MKKRLRKKLHKGEFQQYGVSIMVPANTENVDTLLDTLTDIAERHDTIFCGCGLGRQVCGIIAHLQSCMQIVCK